MHSKNKKQNAITSQPTKTGRVSHTVCIENVNMDVDRTMGGDFFSRRLAGPFF
jgi:hypothetical protein